MCSSASPIMKAFPFFLLAVLLFAIPAQAADSNTVQIKIKGEVVEFGPGSDLKTVSDSLGKILSPESPSVSTSERIQYDFIAVEDGSPLTVLFDFDKDGKFSQAIIAANSKKENPVAQELATRLEDKAGKGKKVDDVTVWQYAGMSFTLVELVDEGEESIYQMTIENRK